MRWLIRMITGIHFAKCVHRGWTSGARRNARDTQLGFRSQTDLISELVDGQTSSLPSQLELCRVFFQNSGRWLNRLDCGIEMVQNCLASALFERHKKTSSSRLPHRTQPPHPSSQSSHLPILVRLANTTSIAKNARSITSDSRRARISRS